MKITLRKASQLETALQEHSREILRQVTPSVQIPIHADVLARRVAATTKLHADLERVERLEAVRFVLRHAIGQANAGSGISQCLTEIKQAKDHVSRVSQYVDAPIAMTDSELEAEVTAKRVRYERGGENYPRETVHADLFAAENIRTFKDTLRELHREIARLQDKLSELNNKTTITLSKKDWGIMEAEGLV